MGDTPEQQDTQQATPSPDPMEKIIERIYDPAGFFSPAAQVPPPPTGITFTDLHDPAASSKFFNPARDFDNIATPALVAEEMAADPALRAGTVVIAPAPGVPLQRTFEAEVASVQAARAEQGLRPLSDRMNVQMNSTMFDGASIGTLGLALATLDPAHAPQGEFAGFSPFERSQDRVSLVLLPIDPHRSMPAPYAMFSPGVVPTMATIGQTFSAMSDSNFTAEHEMTHSVSHRGILGPFRSVPELESTADGAAGYAMAMRGDSNLGDRLQTRAELRALRIDDHALAADGLLQARHNLLSDPEGMKKKLEGATVTEREAMMMQETLVDGPSGGHPSRNMQANAGLGLAQDILSGRPVEIPESLIDCDGAVSLLRTQMALERHDARGAANPLTQKMPEIWDRNREGFAEAQDYMRREYGIAVTAPALSDKPNAPREEAEKKAPEGSPWVHRPMSL